MKDKFLANEDENAYVQLEVFGDPAPTISWFKVISSTGKILFLREAVEKACFTSVC